jgi:hypothetical protein
MHLERETELCVITIHEYKYHCNNSVKKNYNEQKKYIKFLCECFHVVDCERSFEN